MTGRICRDRSRRAFVQALLAAAASPLLRQAQAGGLTSVDGGLRRTDMISHIVRDIEISEVGKAYLVARPEERSTERLVSEIERSVSKGRRSLDRLSEDDLGLALANAVRHDFECGQIVNVQGWRLSQTETRVCALVHLVRAAPVA